MNLNSSELAEPKVSQAWREVSAAELGSALGLFAHDLRNPLAAMVSNLSYIRACPDMAAAELDEVLSDLELSVESLGRVIDHLGILGADLSAAQAVRKLKEPEEVDEVLKVPFSSDSNLHLGSPSVRLTGALEQLLPAVQRAAQSHEVTFLSALSQFGQVELDAKEPHFTNALSALLHNAIALSPSRKDVCLSAQREPGFLLLCIEDSGPSIDPSLEAKALSALHQNEIKTLSHARYSRGMGLYAAARSAEWAGAALLLGEGTDPSKPRSQMALRVRVAAS